MEPVFHITLPILILLFFFPRLDKKLVFGLAFFMILMDFDIFIADMHRILFHNILFIIMMVVVVYFLLGKLASKISLFYLSSHILLDLYGPIAVFYPFYRRFIEINFTILKVSSNFLFDISLKTYPLDIITEFTTSTYLTTEGSLFLVFFIIIGLIWYFKVYSPSNSTREKHLRG